MIPTAQEVPSCLRKEPGHPARTDPRAKKRARIWRPGIHADHHEGIPLAYNKDMQEDKELTFDAIGTVKGCLALFTGMISSMSFRKEVMEASAKNGFTNATDASGLSGE